MGAPGTVEKSIRNISTVEKHKHLTADRVMTANIKSLFYVIMIPFRFIRTCRIFQADFVIIKMGLYWPNFQPGLYFIIAHDNNITEQTAKLLKFEILYISN